MPAAAGRAGGYGLTLMKQVYDWPSMIIALVGTGIERRIFYMILIRQWLSWQL